MRKKRKREATAEERARRADFEAGFQRSQRKLAERIAYHEARIAARERGEDPDAATA
jgi:hypothetical protein